jgi:magnesium transporter
MTKRADDGGGRLAIEALERYPAEGVRWLEAASHAETAALLERVRAETVVAVLQRLTPETASRVLEKLNETTARQALSAIDPSRAVSLLARLEETERERLLALPDPRAAKELRALAAYPPDTAGAMMDPWVLGLPPDTAVRQALVRLRAFRSKRVRRVFLVDEEGRLSGSVRLQDLAMARPSQRLAELVDPATGAVSVAATAGREEVVETLARSRLSSLPVVSFEGRLLGVIRDDVLLDAATAEASADVQTMFGASREERALSPIRFAVRKRLPWLEINLATAFLAAAVVGLFEGTIARFTALAVLLPVVAGQAGNTGAQALAVTMRGLALREIRVRHGLRVGLKELGVAFFNGLVVAVTTATAVWFWSHSLGLTLVIGLSMVLSMVAAGLSGAAIPMMLTAVGQDPAQSSSIILTTVTDVVGFFSFLGIATLLAGML